MKLKTKIACVTTILCWFAMAIVAGAQDSKKVSFENDIKPILENHCVRCHGPDKEEAFRIDERDSVMDYVTENEPEESDLYTSLISDDEEVLMPPPDENDPLDDADIKLVETWIREGADWPDGIVLVAVAVQDGSEADSSNDADANEDPNDDPQVNDGQNPDDEPRDAGAIRRGPKPDQPKSNKKDKPDFWNAIGSLHPATIHFPLGLLMAGGIFALLGLRGNFVMGDCAYYCLWLGTIGAIIACATGWWFSPMENRGTVAAFEDLWDMDQKIFWHRTSALIVTILAFFLALFAASARSRDPDDGIVWKLGLIVLALGMAFVGHKGGELTWGKDHYKDLQGYIQPYIDMGAEDSGDDKKSSAADPDLEGDAASGDVREQQGGAAAMAIE